MRLGNHSTTTLLVFGLVLFTAPSAFAQQRAGFITTLEGKVTVTRASLSEPAPLKFRDEVLVRDRVTTGEKAIAKILLGGKAVVTVREHSTVTITEMPGVSTVDVSGGRVAVAVARDRMKPGDLVEVRTPNAVAGIRGTVIVAEVWSSRSIITVLKGVIDVTRLDAGRAAGGATIVNALQQVTVVGANAVPAPQTISIDDAKRMGSEFRTAPPKSGPNAATAAVNQAEVERTVREMAVVAVSTPGADVGDKTDKSDKAADRAAEKAADKAEKAAEKAEKAAEKAADKAERAAEKAADKSDKRSAAVTSPTSGGSSIGSGNNGAPTTSAPAPAAAPPAAPPSAPASMPPIAATNFLKGLDNIKDMLKDLKEAQREQRRNNRDR